MPGLGTVINVAGILIGGLIGLLFGRVMKEQLQETLCRTCGVCVLFIGIAGGMSGMLSIGEDGLTSGHSMLLIGCLAIGALIGELLNIEGGFERFGEWLKQKTGNAKDARFVDGFVTASLTVCVGAMAIVGSIEDGIAGDWSILATKGILDLIIVLVMTCSMGKGCIFSAIPVAAVQGSVTALAVLVRPLMTDAAISNLSFIGSVMIFCVGMNLIWGKQIRVANLLPAVLLAIGSAFLPFAL